MKPAHGHEAQSQRRRYFSLAWMALLSFVAMYVLMYAMVDKFDNVHSNLNQIYMVGLMAMPMVVIELALMRTMYGNKRLNAAIAVACIVAATVFWFAIREQYAISERQFLKSMIPHHAGAILMCERADLTDQAAIDLCPRILASQTAEIAEMESMLGG